MTDEQAPEVGLDDMARALGAGEVVVDVRERDEYAEAHVPGVTLIPLSELQQRWEEIPRDGRVYVICAAGVRSMKAATALRQAGLDVVSVAGGTKQWQEEGRPIETGGT